MRTPPSITARYFSSCPSDPTSRWTPCPPENYEDRLQVRLGCVRLSPSCPFRLLHTCFLFPAREALPPRSDTALLIRAPEGLQPSRSTRCSAHTTPMFDSSLVFWPGLRFWLPGPFLVWLTFGYQRGLPVLARAVSRRADGSRTTPGPSWTQALRCRPLGCGLPVASTRPAPGLCFSKLNSPPADASVYASPGTSRRPAQDSRSRWFAIPFL